jgi:hypothetical protein
MDPDVALTIAFVGYAVVAVIGIGVLIAHNDRDSGLGDDAAYLGGTRLPSEADRFSHPRPGPRRGLTAQAEMGSPPDGDLVVRQEPSHRRDEEPLVVVEKGARGGHT